MKNRNSLALLIAGDLLVILSFVWIGRSSHSMAITDIVASLATAVPFIISWFAIMPWFGIYTAAINQSWQRMTLRLLLAWAVAGPAALVLRALFLGRPIVGGIIPIFAVVSLVYIGLVALIWRLGYIWWVNYRRGTEGTNL